jgi:hypothetical protein
MIDMNVEHWQNGTEKTIRNEVLGGKVVALLLCALKISEGLTWK